MEADESRCCNVSTGLRHESAESLVCVYMHIPSKEYLEENQEIDLVLKKYSIFSLLKALDKCFIIDCFNVLWQTFLII